MRKRGGIAFGLSADARRILADVSQRLGVSPVDILEFTVREFAREFVRETPAKETGRTMDLRVQSNHGFDAYFEDVREQMRNRLEHEKAERISEADRKRNTIEVPVEVVRSEDSSVKEVREIVVTTAVRR